MQTLKYRAHSSVLAALAVAALAAPAHAATSGANGTHDPSRIVESDGKFYFCGTGGGCASSTDGLVWKSTGLRIPIPAWSTTYTNVGSYSGNQGVWAPDILFYNGLYYIYYSFCANPATHSPCTIGLYTTPTLDSTSSKFKLTDAGKVVNNPPNTADYEFATIDPGPIVDQDGNLWSSWGSGYGKDTSKLQIWITRMGTNGLPLTTDPGYQPPTKLGYGLETGGIEGSYVHYHDGNYYLFWNSGGCCSGASSTYEIHVARSPTITGPYTGAKVWYASTGSIHGPGHMGVYSACGVERFTYHYYPDSGGSVLGENELLWGSDGWPVVGPVSSTPLVPCGDPGTGGGSAGAGGMGGSSAVAGASSVGGGSPGGAAGTDATAGGAGGAEAAGVDAGGATSGGLSSAGGVLGDSGGAAATSGGAPGLGMSGGASLAGNAQTEADAGPASASSAETAAGCACSLTTDSGQHKRAGALLLACAGVALFGARRRRSARQTRC